MKVINYNYGYSNTFNCSIKGKIIVSPREWKKVLKYLFNPSVKIIDWDMHKRILREDLTRAVYTEAGQLYNIRVSATDRVMSHFKYSGACYHRQNYVFLVQSSRHKKQIMQERKPLEEVKSKEEARAIAQEWQSWQSTKNLSYAEVADWAGYFEALANKFDLTEEFKENGII